ncbi:hypothetical protein BB560_001915 [Smittium megazygosporum]|uniref:J domain-containing protein n=1 Tax=Smittium megazygosporum TaxID=133381 RepID=A0A2T9ZF72_9FUNG|nr:hypothetical protein BB560_002290 [Smittium megazygosporum]PVV03602.1 hypothetical protein BB560_001915 [Smittium megazygosporum]
MTRHKNQAKKDAEINKKGKDLDSAKADQEYKDQSSENEDDYNSDSDSDSGNGASTEKDIAESNETDLYKILNVARDATLQEIKSGYKRLALATHPDKKRTSSKGGITEEEEKKANIEFQRLSFAYSVLSDQNKRKYYDNTGSAENIDLLDSTNGFFGTDEQGRDWTEYFLSLYGGLVNTESIEKFSRSDEELKDLIAAYKEFNGDLTKIFENVMLLDEETDTERVVCLFNEKIKNGELESTKIYEMASSKTAIKNRKKRAPQKIRYRHQQTLDNIADSIAEKYKDKPADSMPSEEEFLKLQEKLFKK